MLYPIIIVAKCRSRIVGGVNKHALYFSRILLLQCFERQQVVPMDKHIVEDVILTDALRGMVGLVGIFNEDTRLQLRTLIFPDPSEFKFLFFGHVSL